MQTTDQVAADPTLRIYAILRGDLKMPAGKAAAQAGHAFLDSYETARHMRPALCEDYMADGHGTKVVLVAPSYGALEEAMEVAAELGLPYALITDSGHILPPHFDGSPIVTALGIGPALRHEVALITNRFELMR